MAFCCQCGNPIEEWHAYCAKCGARQRLASPSSEPFREFKPKTASTLCYIPLLGWIPAIVVLASERFRNNEKVRFHAFQGLYLMVAWLIADWVLDDIFRWFSRGGLSFNPVGLLKTVVLGSWIYMLIKTSQDQHVRLPVIGELAERSLTEQF